ncbi:acylphosphatase [Piscinibacter gummiphilus]|uniref:acylphosphatase n=1 Tax=Piscinibacter gummiphilus TaxID=946333 RepID=A0ABZ0CXF9_9BURK|nr:acylphosphatase [Piscinibacter gummiphilus]WOB07710.1 acylphosphatase [Piscinibacter gummiphilus]
MSSAPGQPGTSIECWSARIRGRVQGVGYRDSCAREADRLGVKGWVRNRLDGSVEVLMLGSPAQLRNLAEWLHRGPPAARVDEVSVTPLPPPFPDCERFERKPTA